MDSDMDTGQATLPPPAAAGARDEHPWAELATANVKGSLDEETEIIRVLVADDNPTVRKILRHWLTSLGWETLEVQNGTQTLERARQRPLPQAIIADLRLPEIDGCQVCHTLKNDSQFQLIPVIITTSLDTAEERMRALEAGADDFLAKPINRTELTMRLRSLLRVHRFNQELIGAEGVAMALARAVAAKDGYAQCHLEKVATHAVTLGQALGFDVTELKTLKYGAILHNVGKIAIPDAVLEKTGPLTPREAAMCQQHPRIGCDICAPLKPLKPALPIIRHHKEHWDGTGFPDGLRGEQIPLGAQIVGIVDVYVALTSDRPYRKAISHAEAIACLRARVREGLHNPELVQRFVECVKPESGSENAPQDDD